MSTATAEDILRAFTACDGDRLTLILDVRPLKEFKKKHVLLAYSIRLAANGKTLLDYSKNTYHQPWSEDCWCAQPCCSEALCLRSGPLFSAAVCAD